MYINTPKRYRGMQRRSGFSCRRFLFIGLLTIFIAIGIGIYQMRDLVRPEIMEVVNTSVAQVDTWQATQFAPTAVPTRDPSSVMIDADNEWLAGRINFAIDGYADIVDAAPNDVTIYTHLTEGYLTRGNIDEALAYAEQTVTADPFSADAWATRALVYSWEGDFVQGIASGQQALALDPENARAMAFLAYAYLNADEISLATSRAEDAIELDPNYWAGYWVRGLIRENELPLDIPGAVEDFEFGYNLAREQNPAMAGVIGAGLGRTYIALGNSDRAVSLYNEILAFDDSNREVLYWLGFTLYRQLGEWSQAIEPLTDCVDIAPEDVDCWYLLGRARNSEGDQEGALDALETAVELDTPYARHYWWAGSISRVSRSCAAAQPYLEIGYDMVIEGGRPAEDEGIIDLIDAFDNELGICGLRVVPNVVTPEPQAEETETVVGDA